MDMDVYSGDPLIYELGDGGDILIQGGQPKMSSGIENASYFSLFVDSNWWGNSVDPQGSVSIGSRNFLPLTRRAKLTPDTLKDAKAAAEADHAWMITDGLADSVEATASIVGLGQMALELIITEPSGTVNTVRWKLNWARMSQEAAL